MSIEAGATVKNSYGEYGTVRQVIANKGWTTMARVDWQGNLEGEGVVPVETLTEVTLCGFETDNGIAYYEV